MVGPQEKRSDHQVWPIYREVPTSADPEHRSRRFPDLLPKVILKGRKLKRRLISLMGNDPRVGLVWAGNIHHLVVVIAPLAALATLVVVLPKLAALMQM